MWYVFFMQEQSTIINVNSYWPRVVASGAMLLATDSLSPERTLGSYMLSACDFSLQTLSEFSHLQGSSKLLLKFAKTYDSYADELLDQYIFHTPLQRNVTHLRNMIQSENFVDTCENFTYLEKTELIIRWGLDTGVYILKIDDLRGSFIIPSILQVDFGHFAQNVIRYLL